MENINWKRDKKYFKEEGDKGFSVSRNKYIVELTIKKHDENIRRKEKFFDDMLRERAEAASYFLDNDKAILGGKGIAKYLGKSNLAHLRGQDITNQLKQITKPIFTPQEIVSIQPRLTDFLKKGLNAKKT